MFVRRPARREQEELELPEVPTDPVRRFVILAKFFLINAQYTL